MEIIEVKTLIDITQTKVVRLTHGTQIELDQNRNFNTLRQCLEMRAIILFDQSPHMEIIDIKNLGFGSEFKGKHRVWTFYFNTDRPGVYEDITSGRFGFLINDIHQVPIVLNLTETININTAMFDTKNGRFKNTIISSTKLMKSFCGHPL